MQKWEGNTARIWQHWSHKLFYWAVNPKPCEQHTHTPIIVRPKAQLPTQLQDAEHPSTAVARGCSLTPTRHCFGHWTTECDGGGGLVSRWQHTSASPVRSMSAAWAIWLHFLQTKKEFTLIYIGSGWSWRAKAVHLGANWCLITTRLHVCCQDLNKRFSNDFTNRSYIRFTKPRNPTAAWDAGHSRHHTEQLPRTGAAGTQCCWGKHGTRSISLLRSLGVSCVTEKAA